MARRTDVEARLFTTHKAPRSDVLLVLYDEIPTDVQRPSGLILPGSVVATSRLERVGTVISVGSKVKGLEQGERVLMNRRYGIEIPHEAMATCKLVMVSADQVLALLIGDAEREDYSFEEHGLNL